MSLIKRGLCRERDPGPAIGQVTPCTCGAGLKEDGAAWGTGAGRLRPGGRHTGRRPASCPCREQSGPGDEWPAGRGQGRGVGRDGPLAAGASWPRARGRQCARARGAAGRASARACLSLRASPATGRGPWGLGHEDAALDPSRSTAEPPGRPALSGIGRRTRRRRGRRSHARPAWPRPAPHRVPHGPLTPPSPAGPVRGHLPLRAEAAAELGPGAAAPARLHMGQDPRRGQRE